MIKKFEKILKKNLKMKMRVTLGVVIAFLLNNAESYSERLEIIGDKEYIGDITIDSNSDQFSLFMKDKKATMTVKEGDLNITNSFTGGISPNTAYEALSVQLGDKHPDNVELTLLVEDGDVNVSSVRGTAISVGGKTYNENYRSSLTLSTNNLNVKAETGISAYVNSSIDIDVDNLKVEAIKNSTSTITTLGVGIFTGINSNIDIKSKNNIEINSSYAGIWNSLSSNLLLSSNNLKIVGKDYAGILNTSSSLNLKSNTINIQGNIAGIYTQDGVVNIQGDTNSKSENISIGGNYSVYADTEGEVNIDSNLLEITGKTIGIYSKGKINIDSDEVDVNSYYGIYAKEGGTVEITGDTNIFSGNGAALYSQNKNSEIRLSEKNSHTLVGDIVALDNSSIIIDGKNNFIGKEENLQKDIEVIANDNGKIHLNLTSGILTGRVDNFYGTGEGLLNEEVFRNNKSYIPVANSNGIIDFIMDKESLWVAKGQSYVNNINFDESKNLKVGENFGVIDLSSEIGTSINIQNLGSNGTFKLKLNSDIAQGYDGDSDMLYIKNIVSENTILNIVAEDAIYLNPGEKLRFATLGEKLDSNYNDKVIFNVLDVKEKGIKNVSFSVGSEEYKKEDVELNEKYNGLTTSYGKPGNDFIDSEYENGTNHYLTKNEDSNPGGDGNINDGGITIIETAKSNYANAVYLDNLNKRLGDMTFADGDEGIWVRMRNDRVGEDKHYKLNNFMTQLGYDKKYVMDNGDEHRGIAFEYGKGSLEYKELIGGETKADKYILTLYDTRLRNNGVYTDYVLRGGALSNKFTTYGRETGAKVKGEFKNMLLSAGVEGGKRFDINENWYFEPQLQGQYTYISETDYTTNQGTKVELASIHSLIGRAGARLGYDYYGKEGKDSTLYMKADINQEFLGDEKITARDTTGNLEKTYHNDKMWYDIGVGVTKEITKDFNISIDVEKQFGKHRDNDSWQFNLGFRYIFKTLN